MTHENILDDKKIRGFLEQLKQDKALIRIKRMDTDVEQLTLIVDIRKKGEGTFVLIDCPDSFVDRIDDSVSQIQCEFSGSDNLPYFFYADIFLVDSNSIWIPIPTSIRRRQLRRDFRVNVPSDTLMEFRKKDVVIKNNVINLSLGGSFGALISARNMVYPVWPLCVGDVLTGIELIFRSNLAEQRVCIRKAMVVRFEENPPLNAHYCAIHFIDMDRSEEKALTEMIYVIQREYLKRRLTFND